jgi:tRNA threonylcarbamoyladenosine biosynthesis protein TsaB
LFGVNLLVLDTSTQRAALALVLSGGEVRVAAPDPAQRHGRNLIPAIQALLAQAGLAVAELDGLAVGLGPGSYTGLRIGLTAAKTLAYAAGKPLVGLDSLEAIARNAPAAALRVSVAADAQRGDLYVADFRREGPEGPLLRLSPTHVEPRSSWLARLVEPTCVLGPAVPRLGVAWPPAAVPAPDEAHWPDGRQLAALARDVWATGRRDDPWFLEPLYLRRSAAEEQWPPPAKT